MRGAKIGRKHVVCMYSWMYVRASPCPGIYPHTRAHYNYMNGYIYART